MTKTLKSFDYKGQKFQYDPSIKKIKNPKKQKKGKKNLKDFIEDVEQ
jgi:hypothetical protein